MLEAFSKPQLYRVQVSCNVQDLSSVGTACLLDGEGNVIAKFWNGVLVSEGVPVGNNEVTAIGA